MEKNTTEITEARIERTLGIIAAFGGAAKVARITGRTPSRVYSWTYTAERHGTDGIIPARIQEVLIAYSRSHAIGVKPCDFFPPDMSAENVVDR